MDDEIELVSDGDGLLVVGSPSAVDRFLVGEGFSVDAAAARELPDIWAVLGAGGALAHMGTQYAENSGRWLKLTAESAQKVKEFGLMPTKSGDGLHVMIGKPGQIQSWVQAVGTPAALLSVPVLLPMIATVMSQQAMQQQIDEIQDYLVVIEEKIDDILRAQQDAALAEMIGVDLVIQDAMAVRTQVGRVSDVTWSKVQGTALSIARTQAYAIRQLDALADRLDAKADLGDIAKTTKSIEPQVREWLVVLATCFQLQDALSILELDRVLDASPEELDRHRIGLRAAREHRLSAIGAATLTLLQRMDATSQKANGKVLLNPFDAPNVVRSSSRIATNVLDVRARLGIESQHEVAEAKRWRTAAGEVRDRLVDVGSDTIDRASDPFRKIDLDGDGVPDRSRAALAADEAGSALRGAASGVAGAVGTFFKRGRPGDEMTAEDENDGSRS